MKISRIVFTVFVFIFVVIHNANSECYQDAYGGQCAIYVRGEYGNDYTKMPSLCNIDSSCGARFAWVHWNLGFGSGKIPFANSIMVMDAWSSVSTGHMARVLSVTYNSDNTFTLRVNESNWDLDEKVDCNVNYKYFPDISAVTRNGGINKYPVLGFIYGSPQDNTVIKFTDSNSVYLYSNNQLWWISNETVYALLGFRKDCSSLTADWSKLVTLQASSRANYTIRSGVIGYPGLPPYNKISYRVSKINCYDTNLDTSKLYALAWDDGQIKFRHITDMGVYAALGYDTYGGDIVDISYDLFRYYGEGRAISSALGNGSTTTATTTSTSQVAGWSSSLGVNYSPILVPPYNVQASALDNNRIQLTWTLPNNNGSGRVRVYYGSTLLSDQAASETIIITNLNASTQYCFQVSLYDSTLAKESAKSPEVCAMTNANPLPPADWTIVNSQFTTQVDSSTYQPSDEKYSYERLAGKYVNYWLSISSSNPNLSFEWRVYYTFDDSRVWNAQTSANQPSYLCQNYAYYDSNNQKYFVWHKIEANSLPYIGQYRVELWISGQKAANRCFDLIMPKPDWLKLNGPLTKTSVPLFWPTMGDTNSSGDGVELFLDDNRLIFISGTSSGYTHTNPNLCGTHTYRVREVHVYPAGTFRSPFSDPLPVMIPIKKVTGGKITN